MSRKPLKKQLAEVDQRRESDELHETLPKVLRERPEQRSTTKRDRGWEKREREAGRVVTSFRNVPEELRDRIKEISQEHGVRMGEVGRLFLEHALEAYEGGDLVLDPKLEGGRLTLYPGDQQ
jgi:hypothetical protein